MVRREIAWRFALIARFLWRHFGAIEGSTCDPHPALKIGPFTPAYCEPTLRYETGSARNLATAGEFYAPARILRPLNENSFRFPWLEIRKLIAAGFGWHNKIHILGRMGRPKAVRPNLDLYIGYCDGNGTPVCHIEARSEIWIPKFLSFKRDSQIWGVVRLLRCKKGSDRDEQSDADQSKDDAPFRFASRMDRFAAHKASLKSTICTKQLLRCSAEYGWNDVESSLLKSSTGTSLFSNEL
jgi:hypothetical protein